MKTKQKEVAMGLKRTGSQKAPKSDPKQAENWLGEVLRRSWGDLGVSWEGLGGLLERSWLPLGLSWLSWERHVATRWFLIKN